MNKRNLVVALVLAFMLVSTVAFAQTGSFRMGAGFVGLIDAEDSDLKGLGYELTGRAWFAQLPQLTINGSYSSLSWQYRGIEALSQSDFALFAEYRIYNETKYGFAVNAGWLNQAYTSKYFEKDVFNYLTLGGKGNYVVMDNLQAVASVSYAFNNLFKEEADPEVSIISAKFGAEYDVAQAPGLKLGAYFLYNKGALATLGNDYSNYGFNLGASYAVNF